MLLPTFPNSPRTWHRLIVIRAIAASSMLGGCVEATAYEQATSAAEVQAEARRRLQEEYAGHQAELVRLRVERERLHGENQRLERELAEREGTIDQTRLDLVVANQEKHQEASLVQQLRGDLARVGSSLDEFAEEKAGLGTELSRARAENAKLAARVAELEAVRSQEAADAADAAADAETPSEAPSAESGDMEGVAGAEESTAEATPPPPSASDED